MGQRGKEKKNRGGRRGGKTRRGEPSQRHRENDTDVVVWFCGENGDGNDGCSCCHSSGGDGVDAKAAEETEKEKSKQASVSGSSFEM